MAGFVGADVEELRVLGMELNQQAEQLDSIVSRLTARVTSVAWHGPDARRFTEEWNDRLSVSVRAAAGVLREAGVRAETNARDQEQTSSWITGHDFSSFLHDNVRPDPRMPWRFPGFGPDDSTELPRGQILPYRIFPNGDEHVRWPDPQRIFADAGVAIDQQIPGTSWSYGQAGGLIPGVDTALQVRDIADSLQQGTVPVHDLVDVAAGGLRSTPNPIAYGAGVAVGMWNTVVEQAEKADFPNTWSTNLDYIATNPLGALQGAGEGIISGLPEIVKNFTWW